MLGLSSLELKAALFAATFAAGALMAGAVVHRLDAARYEKLELAVAQAHETALQMAIDQQKRYDGVATAAAQKEARRQTTIAASTAAQLRQVRKHVKTLAADHGCVTYGIVRVLDAATHGVLADDLPLPAGKSDDACAPVTADDLASAVVANYGTARQNAEQLDALIATLRALKAAAPK